MLVLICGDRNWVDRESIRSWLLKLQDWGFDTLIEGECQGADIIAREEAELMGFKIIGRDKHTKGFPAQWNKFPKYGAAGPIRNAEMLTHNPVLVVAFHNNIDASKGTKNMLNQAKAKGIDCILVSDEKVKIYLLTNEDRLRKKA